MIIRILKKNTKEFFKSYPNIFNSNLKEFFKDIASKEKEKIDYNLLSRLISTPSKKTFSFFSKI